MYHQTKSKNGLNIVTRRMPDRKSVAMGIWIKTGGRYESPANSGISHFLEHLLFKGSKKYSCRKIKESIEGVGGALNGFTSEEVTCYLVKLPAQYLGLGVDILSDMVINPSFPKEEIEKERFVILEEIKMYKDLPQSYVYELLDGLLWQGQPLGMSIIGEEKTVRGFSREDFSAYKRRQYTSANIVVSAAGLLDHSEFAELIEKKFVSPGRSERNSCLPAKEVQESPRLNAFNKETEQTHIALGFYGLERSHPLKYAQDLLHVMLGANMSSRLFNEVREKRGLAYEIGTQVKCLSDTGAFIVHAGMDNKKVEETIRVILEEIRKITEKPAGAGEFKRAKDFLPASLFSRWKTLWIICSCWVRPNACSERRCLRKRS
ncbi:MAG: pitrilysin family protein [Candidatus Omnitrophica bacterium]|nr:pitrilysin family protein [Candidatus Omnitrophota bacterium]